MRVLVVLVLLSGLATAESPRTIRLARDRTHLLGAHVTLRLPEGMAVASDASSAVLDWGGARFTLTAESPGFSRATDLRERLAADRELGCARVERLASVRASVAYGAAPGLPRAHDGRALVYAAYGVTADAQLVVLRFYIDEIGMDEVGSWAKLARDVSATLVLQGDPSLPAPDPVVIPLSHVAVPAGWHVVQRGATQHIVSPHGACDIVDGELDARPSAPADPAHVIGVIRGEIMFWSLWGDRHERRAETLVGATWGAVHVQCRAATPNELKQQRMLVEALLH